jgi:hypothetical protein
MLFIGEAYEDENIQLAMHWPEATGPRPKNTKPLK